MEAYRQAEMIAKAETRDKHYRDDVVGAARLAVASGATDPQDIRRAIRRAIGKEVTYTYRNVSISVDVASTDKGEYVALWEALKALPPRQYRAVVLVYWVGLSEEEAAAEMGIVRTTVEYLIGRAEENIKKILGTPVNSRPPERISKRGENPWIRVAAQ